MNYSKLFFCIFLALLVSLGCRRREKPKMVETRVDTDKILAQAKKHFAPLPDKMPGSEKDTAEKIALGKKLYFDKRLSINQQMSCNTCHRLDEGRAGVDNLPTSPGTREGTRGDRNSPTVLNAGFHIAQFWDGRAKDLAEQAKGPVLNPVEMAMPAEKEVVKRLKKTEDYQKMFQEAFPKAKEPISYDNMAKAIAAFERTLITHDRFDDFLKGDKDALTKDEQKGLKLFIDKGCITCHSGPVLGGQMYHKLGLMNPYENAEDVGRMKVTKKESDKFVFKVPSLRNVALTKPYFHDGKVKTLKEAVTKMAWLQLNKKLSDREVEYIVEFLHTLSDKERAKTTEERTAQSGS